MGLKATIQSLVGTAFEAIGDLQETVDYIHEGQEPDYDTSTGSVTPDSDTVTLAVRAVLVLFSSIEKQMPSNLVEVALPGDYVALIPGIDMAREPTTADRLVRLDETWVVVGFTRDPAEGLWKVLIRRVGGGADGELVFHE
jgi:hypothetical protein